MKFKMDDHSSRDFLLILAAVVIVVPLTVWITITVLDRLVVLTDLSDPLTQTGGLNPEQQTIHAK